MCERCTENEKTEDRLWINEPPFVYYRLVVVVVAAEWASFLVESPFALYAVAAFLVVELTSVVAERLSAFAFEWLVTTLTVEWFVTSLAVEWLVTASAFAEAITLAEVVSVVFALVAFRTVTPLE